MKLRIQIPTDRFMITELNIGDLVIDDSNGYNGTWLVCRDTADTVHLLNLSTFKIIQPSRTTTARVWKILGKLVFER